MTAETYQKEDLIVLFSPITILKKHPKLVLKYKNLDVKSSHILVLSEDAFSGNIDRSSPVGYMILIADWNKDGNIIEFSSTKSRIVVRSVLCSQSFGVEDLCDATIVVQYDLRKNLNKKLQIKICSDSEALFNVVINNA